MIPNIIESQWGSNAEFVAIDYSLPAKLPDTVDFESAVTLPQVVSLTVIQSLDRLKSTTGQENVDSCRSWGGVSGFLCHSICQPRAGNGGGFYRFQGKS
jgi:NADPH:quinone reductase-like Zn-dependent oxidoreductase